MSKKQIITERGAQKLLRIGFIENDDIISTLNRFAFMALGEGGDEEYEDGNSELHSELTNDSYGRIPLEFPNDLNTDTQRIVMQAIIDEGNVEENQNINEIGIVDSGAQTIDPQEGEIPEEIFFCLINVPEIEKTAELALQYTVIIEIKRNI